MQSKNLKKYVELKKRLDEECEEEDADDIEEQLEELYFALTQDEIEYLEIKGLV